MSDLTRIGKLVDTAGDVHPDPATIEDACFYPAVLCQIGMPRRRMQEREFKRRNGSASLTIIAGELRLGDEDIQQPLPYGPKPRLVLATLTTIAVQTGKRFIPIGRSLRDFMLRMGLDPRGPEYRSLRQQIMALAACRMTIADTVDGESVTRKVDPISEFRCGVLGGFGEDAVTPWSEVMELSQKYFEYVMIHSVPLDERAMSKLRGSALALDIYTWLAHRLARVREPNGTVIPWDALRVQFGQEYKAMNHFREEFRSALIDVRCNYLDARVEEAKDGLRIRESKPPIPRKGFHKAC